MVACDISHVLAQQAVAESLKQLWPLDGHLRRLVQAVWSRVRELTANASNVEDAEAAHAEYAHLRGYSAPSPLPS